MCENQAKTPADALARRIAAPFGSAPELLNGSSFQARMQDQFSRYRAVGLKIREPKDCDPK